MILRISLFRICRLAAEPWEQDPDFWKPKEEQQTKKEDFVEAVTKGISEWNNLEKKILAKWEQLEKQVKFKMEQLGREFDLSPELVISLRKEYRKDIPLLDIIIFDYEENPQLAQELRGQHQAMERTIRGLKTLVARIDAFEDQARAEGRDLGHENAVRRYILQSLYYMHHHLRNLISYSLPKMEKELG